MKKKIGKWTIEYPAMCNGKVRQGLAFMDDGRVSDFINIYGNGQYAMGSGIAHCKNKKVFKYLKRLSERFYQ